MLHSIRRTMLALGIGLMGMAAAFAQGPKCQTVVFSEELLERFPNAREGCLDVIERDGQEFAVFKARVLRTTPSSLRVAFRRPDGTHGDPRNVPVSPGFRIQTPDGPARADEVAVGQELTAYVKVTEPVIAFEPAEATAALVLVPIPAEEPQRVAEAAPQPSEELPRTAGPLPLIGVAGGAFLVLGIVLTVVRRLRAR